MVSRTGQQIITIHILPNISRSKGNQAMKFGQLIEYNMRIFFFLKHHTQNVVEKLVPNPFYKKSKLTISLDQQSGVLQSLFSFDVQVEVYQNILKLRC